MKLWKKTMISLTSIGFITGATMGSMYAFSKTSKSALGEKHVSSLRMENDLSNETLKNFDAHFISPGANASSSIGKYDYTNNTVVVDGKTIKYDDYLTNFLAENGVEPTLVVYAGSALFQNQYLTAISANDFVKYVDWFMKNVAWGPDIMSLESFTIVKGIEVKGNSIVLGGHSNVTKESTDIKFYPDAFFGALPIWSGTAATGPQSLTFKSSDKAITKVELDALVNAVNISNAEGIKKDPDFKKVKIRKILSSGEIKNDDGNLVPGYTVYFDAYNGLIDKIIKKYPFITSKINSGYYVDDKGNLNFGNHKGFNIDFNVPFIYLLGATNKGFKGIGVNFLKYVGAHEYGHHITLQNASDIAENPIALGSHSSSTAISSDNIYNAAIVNLYLQARAGQLKLARYRTSEKENDNTDNNESNNSTNGLFPKFIEIINGKEVSEKFEDIFGSEMPPITEDEISKALLNNKRRAARILDDLKKVAKNRGLNSVWSLYIENAFDDYSASLSPELSGPKYVFDKKNELVKMGIDFISSFLKDGMGNKINFDINGLPIVTNQAGEIIIMNSKGEPFVKESDYKDKKSLQRSAIVKIIQFIKGISNNYFITGWDTGQSVIPQGKVKFTYSFNKFKNSQTSQKELTSELINSTIAKYMKELSANGDAIVELSDDNLLNIFNTINNDNQKINSKKWWVRNGFLSNLLKLKGGKTYFTNRKRYWFQSEFSSWKRITAPSELISGMTLTTLNPKKRFDEAIINKKAYVADVNGNFVDIYGQNKNAAKYIRLQSSGTSGTDWTDFINPDLFEGTDKIKKLMKFENFINFMSINSEDLVESQPDTDGNTKISFKIQYFKNKFNIDKIKAYLKRFFPSKDFSSDELIRNFMESKELNVNFKSLPALLNALDISSNLFVEPQNRDKNSILNSAYKIYSDNSSVSNNIYSSPIKASYTKKEFMDIYDNYIKDIWNKSGLTNDVNRIVIFQYLLGGMTMVPDNFRYYSDFISLGMARGPVGPQADLISSRVYDDYSSLFSDYTFSLPEVLTRDYVQISYKPPSNELQNLPDFISGVTEKNTGWEYYVDGNLTSKYIDDYMSLPDPREKDNDFQLLATEIGEIKDKKIKEKLLKIFSNKDNPSGKNDGGRMFNLNFFINYSRNEYIGKSKKSDNGFFKDRFLRKETGSELYDDKGNQIKDDSIMITDLNGEKINQRAKAYWMYLLKSKGVGDRNITGIWRSKNRDAVYMWGYLKNDDAKKISYIEFTDKESNEKIYIKVKRNVDNLFYFLKQGDETSKRTLQDEGYTSWMTDYKAIGNYRNSILKVGRKYSMIFVDKNKKKVMSLDAGSRTVITENGKRAGGSPTKIEVENNESIFIVKPQFNIE